MWRDQHYFEVAAWWPHGGYGGVVRFATEALALMERDSMLAKGYDEVHVREVTTRALNATITGRSGPPERPRPTGPHGPPRPKCVHCGHPFAEHDRFGNRDGCPGYMTREAVT